MSFIKKALSKSKTKQLRADADLTLQEGLDKRKSEPIKTRTERTEISLEAETTRLEQKLNQPDTRSSPENHILVIRKLAKNYMRLGKGGEDYFTKAENLYKQFNVLYPFHMEKIDWLSWIEAAAKARLIREARRLLEEARMLFPGDAQLDEIETKVLHLSQAGSTAL